MLNPKIIEMIIKLCIKETIVVNNLFYKIRKNPKIKTMVRRIAKKGRLLNKSVKTIQNSEKF